MQIKQWKDEDLSQYSYAITSDSEKKMVLIDPVRDPQQYLDHSKELDATIIAIIETHPHADFISSHTELAAITGAAVYTGNLVNAVYPHIPLFEGTTIRLGKIILTSLDTPGHSPDSVSILMEHDGRQHAIFSGDALFIGDCGRPDLREGAGHIKNTRQELAKAMYATLHSKFATLENETILYPGHGAGTLCGKNLGDADSSTISAEKQANWALQNITEQEFVQVLLQDQPFVPAYFPFDVELNRKGAPAFRESLAAVEVFTSIIRETESERLDKNLLIVDGRDNKQFVKGHLPNSINLMNNVRFQTWLGSIIRPGERFYLAADNEEQLQKLTERAATIGYESQIKKAFLLQEGTENEPRLNLETFERNTGNYTIVDVRNLSEARNQSIFVNSILIPLHELRDRAGSVPTDKPIVVHCAGGYRSAAGSSIIKTAIGAKATVFDLGEDIKKFL
jgi:hydroxyacylglutathione hydrolase